ncbi:MAG: TMEM175 family protein [Bacteroidetes bacterium]|nr:TMEM175 family protein [Bacteroidota bacterium]
MAEAKHNTSKKHFQLDRISFFTDGVFAIAITLLVIEFKVPVIAHPEDRLLWEKLHEMGWQFLGFIISFCIVGYYWSVHHRVFGYIEHYTNDLIWLNLFFLFSVVLLPFSSGLLGEYASESDMLLPYAFYVINICLTAIMNALLWVYVNNPKRSLLTHVISRERVQLGLFFTMVLPTIFILSLIISFAYPMLGRLIPLTIPFVLRYGLTGLVKRAERMEHKRKIEDVN